MRFPFAPLLALTAASAVVAHRRILAVHGEQTVSYTDSQSLSNSALRISADADHKTIATQHLKSLTPNVQFRDNGDHYTDEDSGITHVYFTQTVNGLDVENAQANVNVKRDGSILSVGSSFVTEGLNVAAPVRRNLLLDPLEALKGVITAMDLPLNVDDATAVAENSLVAGGQSFTFVGTEGAVSVCILIRYIFQMQLANRVRSEFRNPRRT